MSSTKITITAIIAADSKKVWDYYTEPEHITKWNFADPSWHCPNAENDLRVGGKYRARMEARDGSFGFDLEAIYSDIVVGKKYTFALLDGRQVDVLLNNLADKTEIVVSFDAENQNPEEMQRNGWQSILNNFKKYVEDNP